MSGAAWNPKNKTAEELFEEAIFKDEYYDLDRPTLKEFQATEYEKLDPKPSGMAANWAWYIHAEKLYKKLYGE